MNIHCQVHIHKLGKVTKIIHDFLSTSKLYLANEAFLINLL